MMVLRPPVDPAAAGRHLLVGIEDAVQGFTITEALPVLRELRTQLDALITELSDIVDGADHG